MYAFPKNYTLVGFEAGSYVPLVDAMSTAPRRHYSYHISLKLW
jgi:hypothetical protein